MNQEHKKVTEDLSKLGRAIEMQARRIVEVARALELPLRDANLTNQADRLMKDISAYDAMVKDFVLTIHKNARLLIEMYLEDQSPELNISEILKNEIKRENI